MKNFVVRVNFLPRFREAYINALEMEKASEGKTSYISFLPEDIAKTRNAHRDYNLALKANGKLLCAGPRTDYTWALLIYTVDSEEDAKSLIEADPLFKRGFFTDYEISEWHRRI